VKGSLEVTSELRTHALLYDLTVSPLWRDRFDRLFVERIGFPEKGHALLLECGTGGLAVELAGRLQHVGSVVASDADAERLTLARGKADIANLDNIRFVSAERLAPELRANFYELALGDASLLPADRLAPMLRTLWRTVAYDGKVVVYALSRGSFDEFFSIFWEALYNCGLAETLNDQLETLLYAHPTKADLEEEATTAGLRNVHVVIWKEELAFPDGTAFLESPLITGYWLDQWLTIVPAERRRDVKEAIAGVIDRDAVGLPFEISLKAAIVVGARGDASPFLTSRTDETDDYVPDFDADDEDAETFDA
jgi:ubiquinone/menaquinone biosynthesis C-methylase UbiE